jgi:hypothetical protein
MLGSNITDLLIDLSWGSEFVVVRSSFVVVEYAAYGCASDLSMGGCQVGWGRSVGRRRGLSCWKDGVDWGSKKVENRLYR